MGAGMFFKVFGLLTAFSIASTAANAQETVSNSPPLDPLYFELFCDDAYEPFATGNAVRENRTFYDTIEKTNETLQFAASFISVHCREYDDYNYADFGPTLLHGIFKKGGRYYPTFKIIRLLEIAKEKDPSFDVAAALNQTVEHKGRQMTALDLLIFDRDARNQIHDDRYFRLESNLVKLGAISTLPGAQPGRPDAVFEFTYPERWWAQDERVNLGFNSQTEFRFPFVFRNKYDGVQDLTGLTVYLARRMGDPNQRTRQNLRTWFAATDGISRYEEKDIDLGGDGVLFRSISDPIISKPAFPPALESFKQIEVLDAAVPFMELHYPYNQKYLDPPEFNDEPYHTKGESVYGLVIPIEGEVLLVRAYGDQRYFTPQLKQELVEFVDTLQLRLKTDTRNVNRDVRFATPSGMRTAEWRWTQVTGEFFNGWVLAEKGDLQFHKQRNHDSLGWTTEDYYNQLAEKGYSFDAQSVDGFETLTIQGRSIPLFSGLTEKGKRFLEVQVPVHHRSLRMFLVGPADQFTDQVVADFKSMAVSISFDE